MRIPVMLWYVSGVDLLRGVACIVDPRSLESTTLWPLRGLGHHLAGVLGICAGLASIAWLLSTRRISGWFFLAPQLAILVLGAISGLRAVALGRYSDGVVVPPAHIWTDQIAWVLLPVFYGAAAFVETRRGRQGLVA